MTYARAQNSDAAKIPAKRSPAFLKVIPGGWLTLAVTIGLLGPLIWIALSTPLPFREAADNIPKAMGPPTAWELVMVELTRPLYIRAFGYLGIRLIPQLGLGYFSYNAVHALTIISIALLFLFSARQFSQSAVAVTTGLALLIGHQSFRAVMEIIPFNGNLFLTLLTLGVFSLCLGPFRWWKVFIYALMIGPALLFKENAVVIALLPAIAWAVRFRGLGKVGALCGLVSLAFYLAYRFAFKNTFIGAQWRAGLGLQSYEPEQITAIFGDHLWLFDLHNIAVTFLSFWFAEPRAGRWVFLSEALQGHFARWAVIEIVGSLAVVILIGAAAWRAWRMREKNPAAWPALNLYGFLFLVVGLCSILAFAYTLDRYAAQAVPFLALAVVAAADSHLRALGKISRTGVVATALLLTMVVLTSHHRALSTIYYARDFAIGSKREWVTIFDRAPQPTDPLVQSIRAELRARALAADLPTVNVDPRWIGNWFGGINTIY